ncbi:DUF4397 domain-containing protein [Blastococcus sp. TML/M2B]|uniref:DUF4397 domain-containing protein n=1 Tax=Blastococcus sp. TML/M2B TaxID=2798727 RepID=UPI00190DEB1C|nr:DUF4397 domain-containing protein [Blastococcus sp. TML/M2B]MBN1094361.1 DUF4397 domain-containing protein [Blastococcus sp. TML/M2B]
MAPAAHPGRYPAGGQATHAGRRSPRPLRAVAPADQPPAAGAATPCTEISSCLTDPLTLPAGAYDLALFPADAPDGSGEPLLKADDVAVPAGANATVVAHLKEDGSPTLTPFVNDTSAVPAGQARVTVRHTAAAPAVDVRAGGTAPLPAPASTITADVVLAGTDTVAIGPADLTLAEGTSTIVYAWGNGEAGYDLAVQTIDGMHSMPAGVPGGSAGLADQDSSLPAVAALSVAGLAVAGAGALRVARNRG